MSAPVLNLGTNPDDRTGTQSNLLRKITLIHQAIDGGFGQASDFFNLRQAKKLRLIKHERQKAKEKDWTFLLFVLLDGEPGWECLVSFKKIPARVSVIRFASPRKALRPSL